MVTVGVTTGCVNVVAMTCGTVLSACICGVVVVARMMVGCLVDAKVLVVMVVTVVSIGSTNSNGSDLTIVLLENARLVLIGSLLVRSKAWFVPKNVVSKSAKHKKIFRILNANGSML